MPSIEIRVNPDNKSIGFSGNKLSLKVSSKANNGLSIINGKLVATKAANGSASGGTMNTPGNALGPTNSTASTSLTTLGFNSTVSRHQKYSGNNQFLIDNDGPVMTKLQGSNIVANGSIASYMISHAGG